MNNKSGFTLVEILAVIAIIAIIFAIAQPVYYMVSGRVKQSSYENKVKYIETAAAKYGSDTSNIMVFVDTLVREGYLEADDEEGNVYDPRDNSLLNCYIVTIYYETDQAYASLSTEKAFLEDGKTCDFDKMNTQSAIINLRAHEVTKEDGTAWKKEPIEQGKWTRSNVILVVNIDDSIKNQVTKITFSGGGLKDERRVFNDFDLKNTYFIQASQLVNTNYSVVVEVKQLTESGEEHINVYTSNVKVMIDKQSPIIYQDEIKVEKDDEWTNTPKKVEVVSSDQSGSGIYGYYFTTSTGSCSANLSDYTSVGDIGSSGVFHTERLKGIYYICVADRVGNISNKAMFTVHKTDQNKPKIEKFDITGSAYANPSYYKKLAIQTHASDNATTNESGVRFIKYCNTTSKSCNPEELLEVDRNAIASYNFPDRSEKQAFCAKAVDYAGNESSITCYEPVWVKSNINVGDACKMCDASNNYCNESIYIQYGNYKFNLYKDTSSSCFGYTNVGAIPLIDTFCCDQGLCHSEYVYSSSVGVYSSLNSKFNTLPSTRTSVINMENYLFGSVSSSVFTDSSNTVVSETEHSIKEFSLSKFPSTVYQGYNYGLPSEHLSDVTCTIGDTQYRRIVGDDFKVGQRLTVSCRRKIADSTPSQDVTDPSNPEGIVIPEPKYETITKSFVIGSNPDLDSDYHYVGAAEGTSLTANRLIRYSASPVSMRARYGLLDIMDYQAIRNKEYASNLSTLLSTVVDAVVYSEENSINWNKAYGHDGVNSDISAIYVSPYGYSAITPMQYGARSTVMSVPFNRSVPVQSGIGSSLDPFIIR